MVFCSVDRAGHSVDGNTADVVHLDFATKFGVIWPDGKNLHGAGGR